MHANRLEQITIANLGNVINRGQDPPPYSAADILLLLEV